MQQLQLLTSEASSKYLVNSKLIIISRNYTFIKLKIFPEQEEISTTDGKPSKDVRESHASTLTDRRNSRDTRPRSSSTTDLGFKAIFSVDGDKFPVSDKVKFKLLSASIVRCLALARFYLGLSSIFYTTLLLWLLCLLFSLNSPLLFPCARYTVWDTHLVYGIPVPYSPCWIVPCILVFLDHAQALGKDCFKLMAIIIIMNASIRNFFPRLLA